MHFTNKLTLLAIAFAFACLMVKGDVNEQGPTRTKNLVSRSMEARNNKAQPPRTHDSIN